MYTGCGKTCQEGGRFLGKKEVFFGKRYFERKDDPESHAGDAGGLLPQPFWGGGAAA
jgi:hypothetical protein